MTVHDFLSLKLLADHEVKYLSDNLESFFTLVYSKYEIIFCVRDYDDSAVPIVEKLIKKYPNIPCKLLIGKYLKKSLALMKNFKAEMTSELIQKSTTCRKATSKPNTSLFGSAMLESERTQIRSTT